LAKACIEAFVAAPDPSIHHFDRLNGYSGRTGDMDETLALDVAA
jgi:hypothetical protein